MNEHMNNHITDYPPEVMEYYRQPIGEILMEKREGLFEYYMRLRQERRESGKKHLSTSEIEKAYKRWEQMKAQARVTLDDRDYEQFAMAGDDKMREMIDPEEAEAYRLIQDSVRRIGPGLGGVQVNKSKPLEKLKKQGIKPENIAHAELVEKELVKQAYRVVDNRRSTSAIEATEYAQEALNQLVLNREWDAVYEEMHNVTDLTPDSFKAVKVWWEEAMRRGIKNPVASHGHIMTRPDGYKARCGGQAMCRECQNEYASLKQTGMDKVEVQVIKNAQGGVIYKLKDRNYRLPDTLIQLGFSLTV
jgi:hypothetical protein